MTTIEDQIRNKYFDWLYNYVCKGRIGNNISYRKLFKALHSIEFDFYIPKDINRANCICSSSSSFSISKNSCFSGRFATNFRCLFFPEIFISLFDDCECGFTLYILP